MLKKLPLYIQLIRLDRPIGIYLLLWPTLWGLWIAAGGIPEFKILVVFVLGVALMRSAGCAINDYADRNIDQYIKRTKNRPLATGQLSAKEALWIFAGLSLVAFLLVLQLNLTTILLSGVALLLAASYPFMKRFHSLPQLHLGAAFAWAIPMGFTAITEAPPPLQAWLLFTATLLWTIAYDTLYALSDKEDDLKIGVKSSAILFAQYDKLIIALLQILTLALLIWVGLLSHLGTFYFIGILIAAILLAYQHYMIIDRNPKRCLQAFLHNHWVGMVIFFGIFTDYFLSSVV
jgi:4-hydroxybenzoate polyprenyltransferase